MHVYMQVETGCVYGLLGPNGAGKSTMMSMLTGIEVCDTGDGFINGSSITWALEEARLHIGLCPQVEMLKIHTSSKSAMPNQCDTDVSEFSSV